MHATNWEVLVFSSSSKLLLHQEQVCSLVNYSVEEHHGVLESLW